MEVKSAPKRKRRPKRRPGRPSLLTPELTTKICQLISAGSYDYVAAEVCGIARGTFLEWMSRGEGMDRERATDKKYAEFANAVRLARQMARAMSEIAVRKIDPKWWLARMHRDRPGEPGWTEAQQLEVTSIAATEEFNAEEFSKMIARLSDDERAMFLSLWNKAQGRVPVERPTRTRNQELAQRPEPQLVPAVGSFSGRRPGRSFAMHAALARDVGASGWMGRGEGTDRNRATDKKYAEFAVAIRLARQMARAMSEITVRKIDPAIDQEQAARRRQIAKPARPLRPRSRPT
jgi:hypothetical protein